MSPSSTLPLPSADPAAAWRDAALRLPRAHGLAERQGPTAALASIGTLPTLSAEAMAALDERGRLETGLDVFMVEAFLRRHQVDLDSADRRALETSAAAAADALDIPPILTYPLYIRENPSAPERLRRFTPLAAEVRFIRMHRLIEDAMDRLLPVLAGVPKAADPVAALDAALPELRSGFRLINRTMAGFRSPARMPHADFFDGFRPYYDSRKDPATGALALEGPSGLQSAAYRLLAMRIGYRDASFDRWTDKLMRHQLPAAREALRTARADRDAGRSLLAVCESLVGPVGELPPLHPRYAPQLPRLFAAARAGDYVSSDIEATFDRLHLVLGAWPAGAPHDPWPDQVPLPRPVDARGARALGQLREIEAMIFGFQMEHAATAAAQIGTEHGTGGTSGVEFLLLATFRRAFPLLWTGD